MVSGKKRGLRIQFSRAFILPISPYNRVEPLDHYTLVITLLQVMTLLQMIGFFHRIVLRLQSNTRFFVMLFYVCLLGFLFTKIFSEHTQGHNPILSVFGIGMFFALASLILAGVVYLIRKFTAKALPKILTYLFFLNLAVFLFIKTFSEQSQGHDPVLSIFGMGMFFALVGRILFGVVHLIRDLAFKAFTKILIYLFILSLVFFLFIKFFIGDAAEYNSALKIAGFGLIISVCGLFTTAFVNMLKELFHDARAKRRILLNGIHTQGVIISLEKCDIPEGPTLYLGGIKFYDQEGKQFITYEYVGSDYMWSPDFDGVRVIKGNTRNVLYDPKNPYSCLTSAGEFPNRLGASFTLAFIALFMGLILVLGMPVVLYFEIF